MEKTLKNYFIETGLSFKTIAEKHNVDYTYLNKIVNGKTGCSLHHFIMIAGWVKMPRDEAINEWESREIQKIKETSGKYR